MTKPRRERNDLSARADALGARVMRDPRWRALVARDKRADGTFFYSVKTTGVYCLPSCGARAPRPENVAFHPTRAGAELAGFRACKRCKPDQRSLLERHSAQVEALCRLIEAADAPLTLKELASHAGWSSFHTQRLFKAITGLTPRAYAMHRRAMRVRARLDEGSSVTEAIYAAGYGSSGRFYEQSNQRLGMSPTRYRAGGADIQIHFAIAKCSLGSTLVAATARGLCAILIGNEAAVLTEDLRRRFPRAQLVAADASFEKTLAKVVRLVEQPRLGLALPLDIQGTAFQQRVWQALRNIPWGTTTTYRALAESLGAPLAARAVAGACAANPLAIAIPCHRVVRSDGGLSGYRWGVERKRALLARESGKR